MTTPDSTSVRSLRLSESIRHELMQLLISETLRDPNVQGLFISQVQMTGDLRIARIYLRHPKGSDINTEQAVNAMQGASTFLRKRLSASLKVRHVPELRFFWDRGVDHAQHIEDLLNEVPYES